MSQSQTPLFDVYVDSYDETLNHALAVTGAGKDYFCRERLAWLGKCLKAIGEQPRRGMDYGCGNGSSTQLFASLLGLEEAIGVDVAIKTIEKAREHYEASGVRFSTVDEEQYSSEFDVVYCNGVFHHINKAQRPGTVDYIYRSLRPGGIFALWENNFWSPAARYVMSRCAFDKDAQMIAPHKARGLLRDAGFEILATDFLFIFPAFLSAFRPLESKVRKLPIGGQCQILARKKMGTS